MTNFRQPKNLKRPPKSIDGFITRGSGSGGGSGGGFSSSSQMKSRFQTSYKPKKSDVKSSGSEDFLNSARQSTTFQETWPKTDTRQGFSGVESIVYDNTTNAGSNSKKSFRKTRHKKDKKHRPTFKKIARSFAVLSVALVIGVSSLFAYGYIKARNIFRGDGEGAAALQQNVDPSRLNGEGDGRVNILVLGKGGPGETAPDLTDTLLLASIDPVQNETALVSVPRDMYVKNDSGDSMKINAIYSTTKQARLANGNDSNEDKQAAEDAGLKAVKDSVSEILGVPVHYYVMVDFKAFEDAINTVGGITVDVKEPLYDQSVAWLLGGNPLVAGEGLQTFDGKKALLYSRSRMGSSGGDFDRTQRQREVIIAMQTKIMSVGTFSNPFKVVELLSSFGDRVRTDLNGTDEIKRLYEITQNIGPDKVISVGLADPPNVLVTTDTIGNQSVVVPTEGLYRYGKIQSFIRNNLRDAYLKSEDARVLILNGTETGGLATATMEELKSYGYNVTGVDNAPTSDYVNNILIDLTNGEKRYTKSYLERRLNLVSTTNIPTGVPDRTTADFVIILGTDEIIKATN